MLLRIVVLSLLGCFAVADSQSGANSCASHFQNSEGAKLVFPEASKIKIPEAVYKIKVEEDFRFKQTAVTQDDLADLFNMLGHTQFLNSGIKLTQEKGSLFLARRVDDLITVQAEYVFDKPNKAFHLIKLSAVNSKNGQDQTLTKEPLDYSGKTLAKREFGLVFEKGSALAKLVSTGDLKTAKDFEGTLPETHKATDFEENKIQNTLVKFPTSITGHAFEKVLKWSNVIEHLDHSEINVVDSINKQRWSIAKGQFRRFVEFAKDRFFKQAFGLLVIYFIVDGMSSFSQDVARYVVNIVQSQESTISLKVKETHVNGEVVNKESKFKILLPKKEAQPNQPPTGGNQ